MTAPRSVWVLVWPDGQHGYTYPTYEAAHQSRERCEAYDAVVIRYDVAGVQDVASPQVAAVLPPPVAPAADAVLGLQHGCVTAPAVEAEDSDKHRGGRDRGAMPAGSGHKSTTGGDHSGSLTSDPSPTLAPMRHPVTGRYMAGDCERDCLEHCAGLCGIGVGGADATWTGDRFTQRLISGDDFDPHRIER